MPATIAAKVFWKRRPLSLRIARAIEMGPGTREELRLATGIPTRRLQQALRALVDNGVIAKRKVRFRNRIGRMANMNLYSVTGRIDIPINLGPVNTRP